MNNLLNKDSKPDDSWIQKLDRQVYYLYVTDQVLNITADKLADFTKLLKVVNAQPIEGQLYLQLDNCGLAIVSNDLVPLYVHELYAKLSVRQQYLKDELLVQAIRGNTNTNRQSIEIWDLTAGLGKDAFILASFGYMVTMVEQHPILATILYYALNYQILPSKNLTLVFANSLDYLANTKKRPNVIYLDPMFKDNKTAKAKKDMQIIQQLTADLVITSAQDLFSLSYTIARDKVVVKRDNKQENIIESPKPSYVKSGKTIRFDIYQA